MGVLPGLVLARRRRGRDAAAAGGVTTAADHDSAAPRIGRWGAAAAGRAVTPADGSGGGPRSARAAGAVRRVRRIELAGGTSRLKAVRTPAGWELDGAPATPEAAVEALDALVVTLAELRALDAFRPGDRTALGLDAAGCDAGRVHGAPGAPARRWARRTPPATRSTSNARATRACSSSARGCCRRSTVSSISRSWRGARSRGDRQRPEIGYCGSPAQWAQRQSARSSSVSSTVSCRSAHSMKNEAPPSVSSADRLLCGRRAAVPPGRERSQSSHGQQRRITACGHDALVPVAPLDAEAYRPPASAAPPARGRSSALG